MNYFFLNKKEDFQRGCSHNFELNNYDVQVIDNTRRSVFFSRVFEGDETPWQRMKFDITQCNFEIRIYTSNHMPQELYMWLNPDIYIDLKYNAMHSYLAQTIHNSDDIFMYNVKGRYIWFSIEITVEDIFEHAKLSNIFIYFNSKSLIHYLPEIYQNEQETNGFLTRFLMIFQSFYEEINEQIENESLIYNPFSSEYLDFLSQLIGLEEIHVWSEEKLRILINYSKDLYHIRGTKQALLEIVSLFTDGETYITETDNCINILIQEKYLTDQSTIRNIIQRVIPVGIYFNVIILKDHMLLGDSTYLGINTKLISYEGIDLLGTSRLNYTTIGNDK